MFVSTRQDKVKEIKGEQITLNIPSCNYSCWSASIGHEDDCS